MFDAFAQHTVETYVLILTHPYNTTILNGYKRVLSTDSVGFFFRTRFECIFHNGFRETVRGKIRIRIVDDNNSVLKVFENTAHFQSISEEFFSSNRHVHGRVTE